MAVPVKESLLASYAPNFATIVSAAPATYNVVAAQCTALTTASTNFVAANNAANADGMKNKSLVTARNSAKLALLNLLRPMYLGIQALTSVTDQQKVNLGITIRKIPSPQPAPSTEPVVNVVSSRGRTVRLRFRDATSTAKRGKPAYVSSATILSHVGATPPDVMSAWKFEANVSRTLVDVTFPDTVALGSQVWFTVFWSNRRDQSGPASDPVSAYLQLGSVSSAA